ncbi:MAG: hypothetical protein HGB15_09455 [Chlorobaculum sp.]|nr:hypothetical protein [Chlorobaculum sp.]
MKGHKPLDNSCFSCHRPFAGTSQQCAECHKPADIGTKNVAGRFLAVKSSKALFHRALSETSCVRCHTDHKGRQPKYTLKTFRHDTLPAALKNDCIACHNDRKPADVLHRTVSDACATCHSTDKWKSAVFDHSVLAKSLQECVSCHKKDTPGDNLHRQIAGACSSCHGTSRWKPATFDHSRSLSAALKNNCLACHADKKQNDSLHRTAGTACATCHRTDNWKNASFDHAVLAVKGRDCIACHKKDTPNDALHRQAGACSSCHSTTHWKPATFDHSRYFRLDEDHRASCATCHTVPGNYKSYTCMNCHEHSPSRIASEHLEEGIRNYNNCIKCHRSPSEHGEGSDRRYKGWGEGD